MATINPSQDYDIIHTLTYASSGGADPIALYRGSTATFTGTVYYRAGTSGAWTSLSVSGSSTTFPITSTTMQVAHNWNKSGNAYMTPSFQNGTMTGIAISQKAALSGIMGLSFMYLYAYNCSNLKTLDVPDTSGLTSVGINFMRSYASDCTSLTNLAIPDTSGLTSVGGYFMYSYAYGCTSLTTLATPDTSGLTSVGDYFMYLYASYCTSLTNLGVPDTSGLTSVGVYFMTQYARACSNLTSLDVPDTSGLTSVGNFFMFYYAANCTSLTTLAAPDTSSLTSVGNSFMYHYAANCTSLTTLATPDTSGLTSVGDYFMDNYARGCSNLVTLEVPDTSGLTSVGSNFMYHYAYGCSNLTTLAVPDTSGLTSAGNNFMGNYAYECSSLTSLAVPDTSGLTSVGGSFMHNYAYNCSNLTALAVPDTSGLTSVGSSFMRSYAYNCSNLTALAVPDTSGLTSVGNSFMSGYAESCTSLTTLEVPDTSGLTSIGDFFMSSYANGCSSLTQLILPKAGWFKANNVNWSVPSTRLGNLKGSCIASDCVDDWKGLTTSGKTLHTNYIRDVGQVDNILDIYYDTTLNYGSGTYEDVAIRLGANTASGVTLGLGGSPTFRALVIQSENSSAHTVNFDGDVTVDKFIAIGSSTSNKLTLNDASDSVIELNPGATVYGQNVHAAIQVVPWDETTPPYIGSSSTASPLGEWLLQDPPQISTLVDEFNTLNTNDWDAVTLGSATITSSNGKLTMGWMGSSSSYLGLTTKNTYDLIGGAVYLKVDSASLQLALSVTPVFSGGSTTVWAPMEDVFAERYYRISATSDGVASIDKYDGSSWSNLTTETIPVEQLRSVRLNIGGSRNMTDGNVVIDSVGMGPGITPVPKTFPNGYMYRKKITVNPSRIYGSHTNFISAVDITDSDLKSVASGGKVHNNPLVDIRFESLDGNKLPHEIEEYDRDTGKFVGWVKVPTMETGASIYLYYGKDLAPVTSDSVSSWSSQGITVGFGDSDLTGKRDWNGSYNKGEFYSYSTYMKDAYGNLLDESGNNYGENSSTESGAVWYGYFMYHSTLSGGRFTMASGTKRPNYAIVRYTGSVWQYNNNSTWVTFTPDPLDMLVARLKGGTYAEVFQVIRAGEENPTDLWVSSEYRLVQHMASIPDGSTATKEHLDSGWYSNSGSSFGAQNANNSVPGKIGKGINLDGVNDYLHIVNDPFVQVTGDLTISIWVYPRTGGSRRNIVGKAYGGEFEITQEANNSVNFYWGRSGANSGANGATNGYQSLTSGSVMVLNSWNQIVVSRKVGSGGWLELYINGVMRNSATPLYTSAVASSLDITIGNGRLTTGFFNGIVDEFRIESVARDSLWVASQYYSQSTPSALYAVGAEESAPPISILKPEGWVTPTVNIIGTD